MTTNGVDTLIGDEPVVEDLSSPKASPERDEINVVSHNSEPWPKPILTLTWFLNEYCSGLDAMTKKNFMQTTIFDIIRNGNDLDLKYVKNLNPEKDEILALRVALRLTY